MPPSHEILTDDYVAGLLAKDAADCSLKYSSMGLDAFKANKRPANQPKPNTRFLNNIIRDTTSHNRALLAKENAESRARLRQLEETDRQKKDEESRREQRSKPGLRDTRKRMLGDIAAILGGPSKKRRRGDDDHDNDRDNDKKRAKDNDASARATSLDHDRKGKRPKPSRHHDSGDEDEEVRPRRHRDGKADDDLESRHDKHKSSHRRGDRSREERRERDHHHHRRREERSSRKADKRGERSDDDDSDRQRSRRREKPHDGPSTSKTNHHPDQESDSDPLEDFIGPAPPTSKSTVLRRGRGLNAAMSGIDGRFAADYDPTIDVTPDPDDEVVVAGGGGGSANDWDNAVEVFRDRQKWKQQGAERLRSAGFTEDQIHKWEKGDKKDESDVQWDKPGGVREWDRGKVLDADGGDVSHDMEYGRLKGT